MQEVTFIIGLPGSGKSTLIEHYKAHPFIDYKIYDDWMTWTLDHLDKDFAADPNYPDLLQDLKNNTNIIISCIEFCDNEFLHKAEYYLKSQFPNLKITRIYFENNPEKAKSNIKYRDKQNGGCFFENENGERLYCGKLFNDEPLYELEIKKAKEFSLNYIIPESYAVFPIIVHTNFQKGWNF